MGDDGPGRLGCAAPGRVAGRRRVPCGPARPPFRGTRWGPACPRPGLRL